MVVDELDFVFAFSVLDHVGNDEREVFLGDDFLFVAEFGDALRHLLDILFAQFQAESLEILADVSLSGKFSESVFARSAEAFRSEVGRI